MIDDAPERPSKTAMKKRMHELQALGERLVELNSAQLAEIDLPEKLQDAVREVQRIGGRESRRRQMQYIGRIMREVDPETIREKLAVWDGLSREHTARLHQAERWRERLIEDDAALSELAALHPRIDTQHLRSLIRNTRAERAAGRPPKSFRELYRALRDALEAPL